MHPATDDDLLVDVPQVSRWRDHLARAALQRFGEEHSNVATFALDLVQYSLDLLRVLDPQVLPRTVEVSELAAICVRVRRLKRVSQSFVEWS